MPDMIVLHTDDKREWLDIVNNLLTKTKLRVRGELRTMKVRSLPSVPEAQDLLDGKDEVRIALEAQGHKLGAVILDLMMQGGTMKEVENWLEGVNDLKGGLTPEALRDFDTVCPVGKIGRQASGRGIPVVILTNVEKFLKNKVMPLPQERGLIMGACGASQYVIKGIHGWTENLLAALEEFVP